MDKATIKPNERGGYSITVDGRTFGNFATRFDAIRLCLRNHIKWNPLDA